MTDLRPGDKLNRDCPTCGNHLIIRRGHVSDRLFIACMNYYCGYTEELPEETPAQPSLFRVDADSGKGKAA